MRHRQESGLRTFGSEFNVAVARVRIDGRLDYLDAGNIPGKTYGASRGLDSEQLILTQIHELKKLRKR